MKWYDYMKRNKEINYIFLKEKKNCRLKVRIIYIGGEILRYKHTMGKSSIQGIALHVIALHVIALHGIALHGMALHCMSLCIIALHACHCIACY